MNRKEQKLERWAEKEFERKVSNIILDNAGTYIVFGSYLLKPDDTGCCVESYNSHIHTFANKRTAISWCVAEKYRQYNLSNNIKVLDRKKQLLQADIRCRQGQAQRGRHEDFYEIVNTKIQPKKAVYEAVTAELEKCINLAKYLQLRGFSNET
jgi:hypothetical protein